jgi:hypothetical protein
MKIQNILKSLLLIIVLSTASPLMAGTNHKPVLENREAEASRLTNRLEEIKAMDKTTLSRSEKKALRVEVREIKKDLAVVSGGVYLSIGAILLIALLLILLL